MFIVIQTGYALFCEEPSLRGKLASCCRPCRVVSKKTFDIFKINRTIWLKKSPRGGIGVDPLALKVTRLLCEMDSAITQPQMFHGNCFDIMSDDERIPTGSVNLFVCDPPLMVKRANTTMDRRGLLRVLLVALLSSLVTLGDVIGLRGVDASAILAISLGRVQTCVILAIRLPPPNDTYVPPPFTPSPSPPLPQALILADNESYAVFSSDGFLGEYPRVDRSVRADASPLKYPVRVIQPERAGVMLFWRQIHEQKVVSIVRVFVHNIVLGFQDFFS